MELLLQKGTKRQIQKRLRGVTFLDIRQRVNHGVEGVARSFILFRSFDKLRMTKVGNRRTRRFAPTREKVTIENEIKGVTFVTFLKINLGNHKGLPLQRWS